MSEDSLDNNSLPPRLYHNQKFRLWAPPLSKTWLLTGLFLYRSCSQPQLVWALITMCLRRWHFVAPLLIPALTLSSAPIPQCFLNFRWMSWMPCLGLITQPSLTINTLRSYGLCIRYSPLQTGDSLTKDESGICQGLVALSALCQSVRCPGLGRFPGESCMDF